MITGVHDSYWTHACDVNEMNRILREKFVELYEIPILENVQYSSTLKFSFQVNLKRITRHHNCLLLKM